TAISDRAKKPLRTTRNTTIRSCSTRGSKGEGGRRRDHSSRPGAAPDAAVTRNRHNRALRLPFPHGDQPMFSLQTIFGQGKQFYALLDEAADAAHASTKALHEMLKHPGRE